REGRRRARRREDDQRADAQAEELRRSADEGGVHRIDDDRDGEGAALAQRLAVQVARQAGRSSQSSIPASSVAFVVSSAKLARTPAAASSASTSSENRHVSLAARKPSSTHPPHIDRSSEFTVTQTAAPGELRRHLERPLGLVHPQIADDVGAYLDEDAVVPSTSLQTIEHRLDRAEPVLQSCGVVRWAEYGFGVRDPRDREVGAELLGES